MEYLGFLIIAKNATIGFLTTKVLKRFFKSSETPTPNALLATVPQDQVSIPKDIYREIVENALKVQKFEIQAVHDEEKTFLLAEITKLNNRPADSDEINARIATLEFTPLLAEITKLNNRPAELDEINARIDALEFTLIRKVNEIITKKLENSKIASEKEKNNE